jgi:hypothetical protein
MRDWQAMAEAILKDVPAGERGRAVSSLDGLEKALRPLMSGLTPEMEPAAWVRLDEDER